MPEADGGQPDADAVPDALADSDATGELADAEGLLTTIVAGIGGEVRPGQERMVELVSQALSTGTHALVQAGTGTGKSVGYLAPAIAHVRAGADPVVVSTATLALQHQLVSRDLPAINDALESAGDQTVDFAVLKGRANYLCLQRLHDPVEAPDDQLELDDFVSAAATGRLEAEAARIRAWADDTQTGDRDELDDVDGRVWRAFAVTSRECVGATKCSFGEECFAERARARAGAADIVVTNHALLALDALEDVTVLPEHSGVIVDEGHELVDRATSAVTAELSPNAMSRALSGARKLVDAEVAAIADDSATGLADALFEVEGRVVDLPEALRAALASVRDAAHGVITALGGGKEDESDAAARRQRARSAVEEVHDVAGAMLAAGPDSVIWVERVAGRYPALRLAPLSVAAALRAGLLEEGSVVVTSATLTLGGDFGHVARSIGLQGEDRDAAHEGGWSAEDVGSPFDFAKQGILYVADDLPRPGREGPSKEGLDRLHELVQAAGGRTLALFSSWRGVEAAAERLADFTGSELLVQRRGDSVGGLVRRFAEDETSVLVGTMSLWQGVDVSGDACILVVIDRIPFPRPNDPLVQARSERAEQSGGNGFTAVSVPKASLMLAQGAGRLIRSGDDRGVVAVLDPRLATARYGAALQRSMPPLWSTRDLAIAVGALQRLAAAADERS
ncbi:MAG: ATP-dependent DNA helicase [Candidatus Nanopelagicales bacterium]